MNSNGYNAQKEASRPPTYGTFGGRASAVRTSNAAPRAGRILGDQRRETAEAAAAASRAARRRLLHGEDEDEGLDENEAALFGDDVYDDDDREADEIYAAVDRRVEAGRSEKRAQRVEAELKRYREENPTIGQQFAAPKAGLAAVSYDEWAAVPDIGDYSVKKQKRERYTPAPDSLLEQARAETAVASTAPAAAGTATDLAAIGAGRSSVLGQSLDRAGAETPAPAAIDATGYLTEMAGAHISSASEVSDIKKARLLLRSVTTTNPRHAPGWIAAARLEEVAGKLPAARALAAEGCRRCPRAEDVWLEAARLYAPERARRVLAQAVVHVPKSVKVWLQAAALEPQPKRQRRVLRRALEVVPRSARLWRAAVDLEDAAGARVLLARAVECVPDDPALWLALAKLQPHPAARAVLSRARAALPTDPRVWVAAAQLEETALGGAAAAPALAALARNAVHSLSVAADVVARDRWLQEARAADKAGFPGTCAALARAALPVDVEAADRRAVWQADAAAAEAAQAPALARAVHAELVRAFPASAALWRARADCERRLAGPDDDGDARVEGVLAEAVEYCPTAVVLWLMLAKAQWRGRGGAPAARRTLDRALQANPDAEPVWLAAAKVETEHGEFARARALLARARAAAPSARVLMKSALLERRLGDRAKERAFLDAAIEDFPAEEKLWLMLAQWCERHPPVAPHAADAEAAAPGTPASLRDARAVYERGVQAAPQCAALWAGLARAAEAGSGRAAGRAVLERGRQAARGAGAAVVAALWREAVFLEVRAGGGGAGAVLARALREHARSAPLWALAIALAPRAERRARTADALRACGRDSAVVLEAAKTLWRDGRLTKARAWLRRARDLDNANGDAWAALHAFEQERGETAAVEEVEAAVGRRERCVGDVWTAARKAVGNENLSMVEVLREASRVSSHTSRATGVFYERAGDSKEVQVSKE